VSEVARLHRAAAGRKEPTLASAAGPNEPLAFPISGAGGAKTAPARVLVIEDDVDLRNGLRQLLEIWGHDVDVAESGPSGIEKVIENPPRFALIDIGLPEMDGYEVARRIREAFGKDSIFLVAVSGYTGHAANQRALECGFDAQLHKPIDVSLLQSLLKMDTDSSPATKSSI
jgi:CheY-like chemotaxis protein